MLFRSGKILCFNAGGVGFKGDFHAARHIPQLVNLCDYLFDTGRRHQRGSTTPKKNTGNRAVSRSLMKVLQFLHQPGGKGIAIHPLMPDMGIKITIGAFGQTERPVDIYAKPCVIGRMIGNSGAGISHQIAPLSFWQRHLPGAKWRVWLPAPFHQM